MKEFIEKLIGRLEEESQKAVKEMAAAKSNAGENYCSGMAGAFNRTVKIVEKLAEEHKDDIQTIDVSELLGESEQVNDFCEWKFTKSVADGGYFYSSGCNHKRFSDLHSFEFCPYCGKKIKVAPYQTKGE